MLSTWCGEEKPQGEDITGSRRGQVPSAQTCTLDGLEHRSIGQQGGLILTCGLRKTPLVAVKRGTRTRGSGKDESPRKSALAGRRELKRKPGQLRGLS